MSSKSLLPWHSTAPPSSSATSTSSRSLLTTCDRWPTTLAVFEFLDFGPTLVVFGDAKREPRLYQDTVGGGFPPVTRQAKLTFLPALLTWPSVHPLRYMLTGGSGAQDKTNIGLVWSLHCLCCSLSYLILFMLKLGDIIASLQVNNKFITII